MLHSFSTTDLYRKVIPQPLLRWLAVWCLADERTEITAKMEHLTDDLPSVRCFALLIIFLSERFDNDFDEIPNRLIQPLIIEDAHIQCLVPVM